MADTDWALRPANRVPLRWITGEVLAGDVHTIFDYLGERFNAEVEPIRKDWSWGYNFRPVRGSTKPSNHGRATAVDFNAPEHPLGKRGTFMPEQVAAIHEILADLDGVVRWGGDYKNRADEMHFEIVGTPRAVALAAAAIRLGDDMTPKELRKALAPELLAIRNMDKRTRDGFDLIWKKLGVAQVDIDKIEAGVETLTEDE